MNPGDLTTLASKRAGDFFDQLPGIRDGRPDSVHDARVACRRLRELLPLLDDTRAAEAKPVLVAAGDQLGRVRDLDVMIALLDEKEAVVPSAALAIASVRRAVRAHLEEERRHMVKKFEALELGRVAALRKHKHGYARRVVARVVPFRRSFEAVLRDRIGRRADRLRAAVNEAAGVYFPNRLHSTRISVKKLRYVVEVAGHLGVWTPPRLLSDLRKAQDVLGVMRDAAVLREKAPSMVDAVVPEEERTALMSVLTADVLGSHQQYLAKRERLLAIVDACDRFASHRSRSSNAVDVIVSAAKAVDATRRAVSLLPRGVAAL